MENSYPTLLTEPFWVRRFWRKIDRRDGPDACWPWRKSTDKDGYGQIAVGQGKGRIKRAHRIAYEITHGECPPMLDHFKCWNRRCCNPDHLRPATNAENQANRDPSKKARRRYRKLVSTEQELFEENGKSFIREIKLYTFSP